ncbi:hypothetical protein Plhal710r2_c006g0029121 [Plasmopara halstedii]
MATILRFRKYKNADIGEIFENDPQYCKWLYTQEILIGRLPEIKEFLASKFKGVDMSYLMNWGKFKVKTIKWIFDHDKTYFEWLGINEYVQTSCPKLYSETKALVSFKVAAVP